MNEDYDNDDNYDGYDEYDDGYGSDWFGPARLAALAAVLIVTAGVVWFGVLPFVAGDDDDGKETVESSDDSSIREDLDDARTTTSATTSPATTSTTSATSTSTSTTVASDEIVAAGDEATVGTETAPSTDAPPSTDPPTSTDAPTSTDTAPSTDAAPPTTPLAGGDAADAASRTYETLPDGSPVPALAIFDGPLITLSGTVPSQAAADRLRVLALANSTDPAAEVASFLTVDPSVPVGVGVRVIEMNSPRFPEGSPSITPEHGAQLDRVSAIMTALPNITVVVVGHADQRGDDETNRVLSTARARAAADYLASQGVDPTRLSSRGAGETELLSLNDDEASLALNRRTEFVFFGLLVEAAEPG